MKNEHDGKSCKQAHPHMSHDMWGKIKEKHAKAKQSKDDEPKKGEDKKTAKSPRKKGTSQEASLRAAPEPAMVNSVSHDRGFVGLAGVPEPTPVEKLANAIMGYPHGIPPMKPMPMGTPTIGSYKEGGEVPKTGPYMLHKGEHVVPNPEDHAGGDPETAVDKLNELMDTLAGARKDAEKFDKGNARAGVRLRKAAIEATKELKSLRAEVQNIKGQRKASKAKAAEEVVNKMAAAWESISN